MTPRSSKSQTGAAVRSAVVPIDTLAPAFILALLLSSASAARAAFLVETAEPTGGPPSLTLDSQDKPHVAYSDAGASAGYSRRSGGNWIKETASTRDAGSIALDLDALDAPRIAFTEVQTENLYYAAKSGGIWTVEQVDVAIARDVSIAIDAQGNPHISYAWLLANGQAELRRARKNGGSWVINTVDVSSFGIGYTSIAIDTQDRPHISYLRESVGGSDYVGHAYRTASNWAVENADVGGINSVNWTSITTDAQDNAHLSYNADGKVNYANKSGGVWTDEDMFNATSTGTSIALDATGKPHITLGWLGDLYYARKTGGTWVVELADGSAGGGYNSSLEVDAAGVPRVSYLNPSTNAVMYGLRSAATGVADAAAQSAGRLILRAQPNVVTSGNATVHFQIPAAAGALDLAVFDLVGRRVTTLATDATAAGAGVAVWDGRDEAGRAVASGTYFLRLVTGTRMSATERLVLVR